MLATRAMVVALGAWVGLAALARDSGSLSPRVPASVALSSPEPAPANRRLAAAAETNPIVLARLARTDPDPWVRANALRASRDPALLRERLTVESDPTVRTLIRRLLEEVQ